MFNIKMDLNLDIDSDKDLDTDADADMDMYIQRSWNQQSDIWEKLIIQFLT